MSSQLVKSGSTHLAHPVGSFALPGLIVEAGDHAARRFVEFFTANIRNPNTRAAYARAVARFFSWCEERGISLGRIDPILVSAYVEGHPGAKPTVKQHLAAIRMLFDWFVVGQVVPHNPAHAVRGPRHVVVRGKTPVLSESELHRLLDSIPTSSIVGLRDRAIATTMLCTFGRVNAVTSLSVEDYYPADDTRFLRLNEKNGKVIDAPVHHRLQEFLDAYLEAGGIRGRRKSPLFRSIEGRRSLSERGLHRNDVFRLVKRRARLAGIAGEKINCHSFRATGITMYLSAGGTVEQAQELAGHSSIRTTKLYDRRKQRIQVREVERIVI